jgi:hypothetical protein
MKNLDFYIRKYDRIKKIELKEKQLQLEDAIQYVADEIDNEGDQQEAIKDKEDKRVNWFKEYLESYEDTKYLNRDFLENLAISDENPTIRLNSLVYLCLNYKFKKVANIIDFIVKNDLELIEFLFHEKIPLKDSKKKNKIYDYISKLNYSFYQFIIHHRNYFKEMNFKLELVDRFKKEFYCLIGDDRYLGIFNSEHIKLYFTGKDDKIRIPFNDLIRMSNTNETNFLYEEMLVFIHKLEEYYQLNYYSIPSNSLKKFRIIKDYIGIPDTQIHPIIDNPQYRRLLNLQSINPIKKICFLIPLIVVPNHDLEHYASNFRFPHLR